jgi:hypothetical protein
MTSETAPTWPLMSRAKHNDMIPSHILAVPLLSRHKNLAHEDNFVFAQREETSDLLCQIRDTNLA